MFDIDLKPSFTREVNVSIPSSRSSIEQSFFATFEALDIPTFNGFDLGTEEGARKFLERTFVGADDLVDKDGHAVEFTLELRDRLIALPWARKGLIAAYLTGFRDAAAKN